MKVLSKLALKFSNTYTKRLTAKEKIDFLIGMITKAVSTENNSDKNFIRRGIYNKYLLTYAVVSHEERLRIHGWFNVVQRVSKLDGNIVEAGVGYGNTLVNLAIANTQYKTGKKIYAFDSFSGFPLPQVQDIGSRVKKIEAVSGWDDTSSDMITDGIQEFNATGKCRVETDDIIFVKGFFENTMPASLPTKIALLHLDSDMYGGTLHVLEQTYQKLTSGAVVIFDEYHDERWPGVKKAVDEFLAGKTETVEYFQELLRFGFIKK